MRTQTNVYVDGNMFAIPELKVIPRPNEEILMQGKRYIVMTVDYELEGSPIELMHVNIDLRSIYES